MRFRTTLLLGLLAVALGAYLYLVEFERAAEEAKKKTLIQFDQEAVSGLTLTYADREIVLVREDTTWRLTKPLEALADDATVKNLVRALAECEVKKTLDDVPADLAPYGLAQPHAAIKIALKDRALPEIRVGKTTPVGFSTYVQRADDKKLYLTSSAFHTGVTKQVKDLRDKQVLKFEEDDVGTLTLQAPDRTIRLVKADGTWKIEQPAAHLADAATVKSLLSTLRAMRATDFPTDDAADLKPYGLDTPRLTLTLSVGKDADQKVLLVGSDNDKNEVYVKGGSRPTVYTVNDWVYRDLDKQVNDFRDKTLLAFEVDAVKDVTVQRSDGEPFTLSRGDDQTWTVAGTDAKPESGPIDQWLKDLEDLKGYEIATDAPGDLAAYGLAAPRLTVVLRDKEAKPLGTLRLGSYTREAGQTEWAAQREGQPTVFHVREYLVTRLDKKRDDFLPAPTPTPASAVTTPTAGDESS